MNRLLIFTKVEENKYNVDVVKTVMGGTQLREKNKEKRIINKEQRK